MTAGTAPSRPRAPRRSSRHTSREVQQLRGLVLASALLAAAIYAFPNYVPFTALILTMLMGSLLLGPRHLPWFIVFQLVLLVGAIARQEDVDFRTGGRVLVLFAAGFIILLTSFRRSRLGVAGVQGESMLVDLRDRILGQGRIPELPNGWHAESAIRSAGGTPFAGDFIVTARPENGNRFEVAVVDVSGKGEGAGTRALLVSGALGGLLGALPPEKFLTSANDYLIRQDWDEGFATAVHLSLDLTTGDFEVRSAGHPPAAQRGAGSGKWVVHPSEGPALGLLLGAEYPSVRGTVRPGDALLLYTDGLVESRSRDIGLGIDQLLGRAESLLRGDYVGGARRLVDQVGSRNDDRALLLLHRR
jgi:hypothetical protein